MTSWTGWLAGDVARGQSSQPGESGDHASSDSKDWLREWLRGVVVDEQGAMIAGAEVMLKRFPDGAEGTTAGRAQVLSNGAGEWKIFVRPGRYAATVTHAGFAPLEQAVEFPANGAREMRLVLRATGASTTVDVEAEGYKAEEASSASRVPMHVLDTPQQVQVLTSDLLQARGVKSMKEAVEVVPAVGLQLGEGRRDNFFIRGFNAVDDMYLDGVRDDAQYYRDLSNTERIEVVEGPAAVLYGRGSSGGLINRVTKKPQMEGTLGELAYTAGSYGEQRGTADVDTLVPEAWIPGVGKTLGFRLTGAGEHEGSQRHDFWMDRYAFAPTLLWQPNVATSLRLGIDRLRDDRLPDRGIPYLPSTGAPAAVPVGNFYGYVGSLPGSNFIHTSATGGTFDATHSFEGGWTLHGMARKAGSSINFVNMYASDVTPTAGGDYLVGRGEYNGAESWDSQFSNLEAYRTGRRLGMMHTVLVGVEYDRETADTTQYNGPTNQTPVSLLNPAMEAPVLSAVLSTNNRFFGQTVAVYGQDLVQFAPRWKALVGVRLDNYRQAVELRPPTTVTANPARTDTAASPRVGLVFEATPWSALYGNYSKTFDPSGENLSLATNAAELKPEVTQNYETGGKFQLLHERLLATTSLFLLDRTNIKTTDPSNPLALLNLGEQRTGGAELNVSGRLARRWMVYGGYAWLDGRIVSSTTSSNGVRLQGNRPAMNPLHSGSMWTTYEFGDWLGVRGLGVGAGLVSRSSQFASTDNLAKLPGYARVDVSAFYRRGHYEVQANVRNVGSERIYDAAQSDYQIYPAAPVSGTVTLRRQF